MPAPSTDSASIALSPAEPLIFVTDFGKAIAYYTDILGFTVAFT